MVRNYILVTFRNLERNKIFSLINIAGLAIGLAACFLIWQYVRFELSYDNFHKNGDQLYRVASVITTSDTESRRIASNAPAVTPNMKAEFPEVVDFCRIVKTALFTSDLSSFVANALEFSYQHQNGELIAFNEEDVWFADASLLSMFSFPLIAGTANALEEPNSVVITESIARKYFGNEPALGKELRLNREMPLKITGVLKEIPQNSHLQFHILISFTTMKARIGDGYNLWAWPVFYNYVLLAPGADAQKVNEKIPAFLTKHLGAQNDLNFKQNYFLQPIKDIHLRSQLEEEQSPTGSERTVYFLSILAFFILIVAWINYINLSTAKAFERSKEVGLRKAVGASRKQLVLQFLFDAVVINFFAVILALILIIISWPGFEHIVGKQIGQNLMQEIFINNIGHSLFVLAVFTVGVLGSGLYAALILSSFNPVAVLKGKFFKSTSGTGLRKAMITFQYVVAVLLIAGTVTIYRQLSYMKTHNTGFVKEQVVVLEAPAVYDTAASDKVAFFKNNIMQLPGVKQVASSADVPGRHIVEGSAFLREKGSSQAELFNTYIPAIDTGFFNTLGIALLEGRIFEDNERMAFRIGNHVEAIKVVVNEAFVRRLGEKDNRNVLGERLTFWWGPEERHAEIIGVVADHHQVSFKDRIDPVMYVQPAWTGWKFFSVRLSPTNVQETLENVESLYKRAFNDNSFSYFFLDKFFDQQYQEDQRFGTIFNLFTALAVAVTCLGLIGLSIFAVGQRTKEMGIRKVLGAPASLILLLFSKDFLKILLIAYVIAIPIVYWAAEKWLQNFSFRIDMGWQTFVFPLTLLVLITLITISSIGIKSAIEAPVKALRSE